MIAGRVRAIFFVLLLISWGVDQIRSDRPSSHGALDVDTKGKLSLPLSQFINARKKAQPLYRPKWNKNELTYKIWNGTKTFPKNNVTAVFENISRLWTADVNLKIEKSLTNKADLNIFFVDIDGYGETLGYAEDPTGGGIFLDREDPLALSTEIENVKFSAEWLLGHQLGHALGLEDSDSPESIMASVFDRSDYAIVPSLIDKNNLVAIYGGKAALNKTMACQKTPVDAMFFMNRKHYLLKGKYYWTFNKNGLQEGPFAISETFPLETIITKMKVYDSDFDKNNFKFDAAFSNRELAYLFKQNVYYKFQPRYFQKQKNVTTGFDGLPPNIDAALYEPTKSVVYFFKGSVCYKFDLNKKISQRLGNATKISEYWSGVPDDVEAATLLDDKTGLIVKNSMCYFINMDTRNLIEQQNFDQFFNC